MKKKKKDLKKTLVQAKNKLSKLAKELQDQLESVQDEMEKFDPMKDFKLDIDTNCKI